MIGGGRAAPDRVAFYNSALIRYLDFKDSYLATHETCHPSDNPGAVLAACKFTLNDGRDLIAALALADLLAALAYHIQRRLSDEAPVHAPSAHH